MKGGFPPLTVVATGLDSLGAAIAFSSRCTKSIPPSPQKMLLLVILRSCFIIVIVGTLWWSIRNLSHLKLCDDSGEHCMRFEGAVQFSTFTRWSWMVEGLYFVCANLHYIGILPARATQILFGISMASAFMVSTITYGVLVPGALLLPQPDHKQGAISILLSPSGHIMHSVNTVFILCDARFSKQCMQQADVALGAGWALLYLVFEWVFHYHTGGWHYPFLNYDLPYASLVHMALFAVFCGYWLLGCRICAPPPPPAHKRAE